MSNITKNEMSGNFFKMTSFDWIFQKLQMLKT